MKKQQSRKVKSSRAPVSVSTKTEVQFPKVQGNREHYRIAHREFFDVVTVLANATKDVSWWTIQPAWDSMFPWLHGVASEFERYTIKSLKFCYVPRVPTSIAGTIVLMCDPDPDDPEITDDDNSRRVLLSHSGAVECSVWNPLELRVSSEILSERKDLYIRQPGEGTVEPRTADFGKLYVAVYGITTMGSVRDIGDLWVDYEINLRIPTLSLMSGSLGSPMMSLSTVGAPNAMWDNAAAAVKPLMRTANTIYSSISVINKTLASFVQTVEKATGFISFLASPFISAGQELSNSVPMSFIGRIFIDFLWYSPGSGGAMPAGLTISADVETQGGTFIRELHSEDLIWTPGAVGSGDSDRARVTFVCSGILPSFDSGGGVGFNVRLNYSGAVAATPTGPTTIMYDGTFVSSYSSPDVFRNCWASQRHCSKRTGSKSLIPWIRTVNGSWRSCDDGKPYCSSERRAAAGVTWQVPQRI